MDFGRILDDWDDYQRRERRAKQNQKPQPSGAGHGPKPNPGPREVPASDTATGACSGASSGAPKNENAGAGPSAPPRSAPSAPRSSSGRTSLERQVPRQPGADDYLNHWLVMHGTEDKDSGESNLGDDRQARIRNSERLRRMSPQAVLDLHGKTAAEAESGLDRFLAGCSRQGMEKVLVIHGKGNHSANEGIMTDLVRRVLENSDFAAGFGFEDRQHGGRGATWVILRGKDYFSR